jgi:hypothetical protein
MPDATAMGRRAPVALAKYGALLRQGRASPAARSKALRRMIRERGAAVSDLHKLTPPQEKQGKFERMLRYFDESQRLLRKGDQSFGESEEAPFLLIFGAREGDKAQAIARELGLDDCAEL